MVEEIKRKLLVIIRDIHYSKNSFLKLGPIRRLTNHDDQSVYVVDDADLNIGPRSVARIDLARLGERLQAPVERALARGREKETFLKTRDGHLIKLATGLVQEFGALTLAEIRTLLQHVGASPSLETLAGYMLCGKAVGWIEERRKGSTDFFFANASSPAAALRFDPLSGLNDGVRRRYAIRQFWQSNDADRYRGIVENEGTGQ
jgi:hypothetical protein